MIEDTRWVDAYGTLHTGLQVYRLMNPEFCSPEGFLNHLRVTIKGEVYTRTRGLNSVVEAGTENP